jgi:hypothetical protein
MGLCRSRSITTSQSNYPQVAMNGLRKIHPYGTLVAALIMKSPDGMHFLLGIFVCAIVLPLTWNYVKATRTQAEQSRVTIAEDILTRKLEVYHLAHGCYPDSIAALSFTNSGLEIQSLPDIQQIKYRHTQSGYTLKYNSILGYSSTIYGQ